MEFVVIVSLVCLLGILANRFGYDSRDGVRSVEERLARRGFSWG